MQIKDKEFQFGDGKISGYLSFSLSLLCLGAVFCFHFPEYLTTPELRQIYPVQFLRTLLAVFLSLAFGLGILSFILSKNKLLASLGIGISSLCVILGGSQVATPDQVISKNYLGLDWFILDILMVALIFIPIEILFGRLKQKIFRKNWQTDLYHFLFSHLLIQVTSFLILLPSLYVGAKIAQPEIQAWIQQQHIVIQFFEVLFLADLTQYWVHRAFHKIPFLWKFHSVHHSVTEMDWLAGSRLHLFDIVVTRGITLIPLFILGFQIEALQAYLVFIAFWATFLHINTRFQKSHLSHYFALPIYHHWHHASETAAIDKNFAVHLPIIDKMFGSFYLPKDKWPDSYGISVKNFPKTYWQQTIYPFKRTLGSE